MILETLLNEMLAIVTKSNVGPAGPAGTGGGSGPIATQINYISTSPWTPTPAVGTVGAEIRFNCDLVNHALVFGAPTGTPVNGQVLIFELMSDASARALNFTNPAYAPDETILPTTTVASKLTSVAFRWHSGRGKWFAKAVSQEK